jgi:hypothetical protein
VRTKVLSFWKRRFEVLTELTLKVNFALEQDMKAQKVSKRYSSTLSLTSALDWGGWLMPRPDRFTPGKKT